MTFPEVLALAFATGFIVEMPVGPVALLCIRQALVGGPTAGLIAGLVPAVADSLYGALGIIGSRLPASVFATHHALVAFAIGALLCTVGLWFARSAYVPPAPPEIAAAAATRGMLAAVVLAAANPGALVVAAAIFAALGAATPDPRAYPLVAVTMLAGAMTWWSLVAFVTSRVRRYASGTILRWMYAASALVFFAAGVASVLRALLPARG